jgi:hypothetical protein
LFIFFFFFSNLSFLSQGSRALLLRKLSCHIDICAKRTFKICCYLWFSHQWDA